MLNFENVKVLMGSFGVRDFVAGNGGNPEDVQDRILAKRYLDAQVKAGKFTKRKAGREVRFDAVSKLEIVAQETVTEETVTEETVAQETVTEEIVAQETASVTEETVTEETVITCKFCGSEHLNKAGKVNGVQRYKCKDCGRTFKGAN